MRPPGSELEINIADFAARLLEVPETAGRARLTAQAILNQFPATTSIIYVLEQDEEGPFWSVRATLGESVEPDPTVPAEAGTQGRNVLPTPLDPRFREGDGIRAIPRETASL